MELFLPAPVTSLVLILGPRHQVIRNGNETEIEARDLVIGDIVRPISLFISAVRG